MSENKDKIDLLIIIPPLGSTNSVYPPYGSMYIGSVLRLKGYNCQILNIDTERISTMEIVRRIIQINPRYLGFSGIIATSYRYIKNLSSELKHAFPDKIQILGGGLASAVDPVMKNTCIDIIVQGEGEITIVELLEALGNGYDLRNVRGLYYKTGCSYENTGERKLIENLDTLPYPAFDLIDVSKYMPDGIKFIHRFTTKLKDKKIYDRKRKRKMLTIPASRGCFAECSFCFRAYRGLRVHSMKYVFDFIEYCIEKFDCGFFTFGDECFASSKARNWAFIEEYKKRKMDIIFRILGMRVDTVDKDILRAYKEIGCWMIEYGFESGSQKMLNIIDKRVTVEQNRNVALWTKEAGIFTTPALVLGMPGETNKTIQETIDFLKSLKLDFKQYLWKYAIPIPGSHLYNFARLNGFIEDEDKYLSSIENDIGDGGILSINFTAETDEAVAKWGKRINDELDYNYFYRKFKIKNRLIIKFMLALATAKLLYYRKNLVIAIMKRMKSLFFSILNYNKKVVLQDKTYGYAEKKPLKIEDFLVDVNCHSINRDISLKRINQKMRDRSVSLGRYC